jgi:hypothetical protein
MDPAIVGATAGVVGSLVGGSASILTAWITQRILNKHKLIRAKITKRRTGNSSANVPSS